jgi:hypothetical protein
MVIAQHFDNDFVGQRIGAVLKVKKRKVAADLILPRSYEGSSKRITSW